MSPRTLLPAALIACFSATPAAATGDLSCAAPDGAARVDLGVGHVPVLAVLSAWIEADGQSWSTYASDGVTPITLGQGFRDRDRMAVDFTDPNVEGVVIRLRTWSVHEGDDWIEAGWLQIPGVGAWPMICGEG